MRNHKPKHEVKQKFIEYLNAYDEKAGEKSVGDKIRHREIFYTYCRYMMGSEDGTRK